MTNLTDQLSTRIDHQLNGNYVGHRELHVKPD